jgi:hypothetical protein
MVLQNRAGKVPMKWEPKRERWRMRIHAGGKMSNNYFETETKGQCAIDLL